MGSVNDLKLQEKLLLLDLVRVQEKVSGAEMLTVVDKLYTYMKVSGRGITYERFYILAVKSLGMAKDRPKLQYFPSVMKKVRSKLGHSFIPSTNLPVNGLPEFEGEHTNFATMATTWLGETRPGMVGKMSAEQTCRMIAAVNATLGPRSDAVQWAHVLEKSGLKEQGATEDQLRERYLHLAIMCGIRTVTDYLTYHVDREPECDTVTTGSARNAIRFPQNIALVAPSMAADYVRHFSDKDWGKVLLHEYNRVFWGKGNEVGLADKTPEDWKLHFIGLRIRPTKKGNEIKTEFHAHVIPTLRARQRFRCEGLDFPFLLRVPDEHTMMAFVGSFPDKEVYDEEDVYKTLDWLNKNSILSFKMQGAYSYWGDRLFEYLESSDIATFPGNKQKLGKLKARWGFR